MGTIGLAVLTAAAFSGGVWPFESSSASAATCVAGTESDFNGDGIRDTAVADPLATVNGAAKAGLVRVILGGGKGVTEISQATPGMDASPEGSDEFGFSMATYDADADGCTDLVVGTPYEDVITDGTNVVDAGAIYVIHGTPTGIGAGSPIEAHSQHGLESTTSNEAYDWFGYSVAAGKTSGGEPYLLVGVPGENVISDGNDYADAGLVHYIQGTTKTVFTEASSGVPGVVEKYDRYGYSLTGTPHYFAVGSPGEAIGSESFAGGVTVFNHSISNGVPTAIASLNQGLAEISGVAETGDGFGTSLSMVDYHPSGTWLGSADALLAIGVPYEDIGAAPSAGSVAIVRIPPSGAFTEISAFDAGTTDVEGDPVAGDFLGQRVALTNTAPAITGTATTLRLAASVPGYDVGTTTDAGAIHTFPALGAAGASDKIITRGDGLLPGTATARDYAGMGLATSSTDLYVGVPYSKSSGEPGGAVYIVPWKDLVSGGTDPVTTLKPGSGGIPGSDTAFGAVIK